MNAPAGGEVTLLLAQVRAGEEGALDRLYPLIYSELRRSAAALLRRERNAFSVQPTELVHDALIRLLGSAPDMESRSHFLGLAARAMRQVLVDRARRRQALKRGGAWERTTLGDVAGAAGVSPEELIALDDALTRLGAQDPRLRDVVQYRYFGGLNDQEIAATLGVTERTVQRDWQRARAWLHAELSPDPPPAA
jgi:RNA polymerase sigma factor (TIGR02999 family)